MKAVTAESLCKSYGNIHAVKTVSFEVQRGELFGIIGADGAGKTTLFRLLVTLLLPTSGTASVGGYDIVKHFSQIRRELVTCPAVSLYQDLLLRKICRSSRLFRYYIQESYH